MANYRPRLTNLVPLIILNPKWETKQGVRKKTYPQKSDLVFQGTFRTYGGSEGVDRNGLYALEDTATIECWFRPDITSETRIYNPRNGKTYEVMNAPEDANQKSQILRFKVKAIGGKN